MAFEPSVERAILAVAIGLVLLGALLVWAASNAVKKLAGLLIASMGALLALAVIGAPREALAAGAALMLAQAIMGAVLLVRLQEAYGGVEIPGIDQADEQDEAAEAGP